VPPESSQESEWWGRNASEVSDTSRDAASRHESRVGTPRQATRIASSSKGKGVSEILQRTARHATRREEQIRVTRARLSPGRASPLESRVRRAIRETGARTVHNPCDALHPPPRPLHARPEPRISDRGAFCHGPFTRDMHFAMAPSPGTIFAGFPVPDFTCLEILFFVLESQHPQNRQLTYVFPRKTGKIRGTESLRLSLRLRVPPRVEHVSERGDVLLFDAPK